MSQEADKNVQPSNADIDPLGRFRIARDVEDFVEREGGRVEGNTLFEVIGPLPTHSPSGAYDAYERLFFRESVEILRYYSDPSLFLKNLFLDAVIASLSTLIQSLSEVIQKHRDEKKSLLLIHLPPIDLAILAIILDRKGVSQVACNFNRAPVVNGISKTFEAHLILLSASLNPRFIDAITPLVEMLPEEITRHEVILDENDAPPDYLIADIDTYIAQAIGFKEHQVILRTDEYPSHDFLSQRGLERLMIIDIDERSGFDQFYAASLLEHGIEVEREVIPYDGVRDIGVYERYIVQKNHSYLSNRVKQRSAALSGGGGLTKHTPSQAHQVKNVLSQFASAQPTGTLQKKHAGLAIGTLTTLMIFLFLIDARHGAPVFADRSKYMSRSTSASSGGYGWGSSTSSSSSSKSYSSSSSSDSKSVSSFGGGGFSKGGG